MSHRENVIIRIACALAVFVSCWPSPLASQIASWRVAGSPIVRLGIGGTESDLLVAPTGATRLPNGNVVVGDLDGYAMKEYSAAGTLVRKYARKGTGPDEVFHSVKWRAPLPLGL